jgi:hypothetical protein
MAAKRKTYLIVQHVAATHYGLYAGIESTDSGRPVMALASHEKAIGQARRLELEARKVLPPFHVGQPNNWSSLGLKKLVGRLEKLGLRDLPDPGLEDYKSRPLWQRWWDEHGGELSAAQVEAIWKLLDLVELYRVVEVPVKG